MLANFTEIDNKIDDLVERMEVAKILLEDGGDGVDLGKVAGLVDSAAALQLNIRATIKRDAARTPDHELESLLIGYSKLLCSKLELVEVLSDLA